MFEKYTWFFLICTSILITLGQILFKQVANSYNKAGTLVDINVLSWLFFAGVVYLVSSGLWIWILRYIDISRAYPYIAFGFVLVPLFGVWVYGEMLTPQYGVGVFLIITGVLLTNYS